MRLDCLVSMIALGERVAINIHIVRAHYMRLLTLMMTTQSMIY